MYFNTIADIVQNKYLYQTCNTQQKSAALLGFSSQNRHQIQCCQKWKHLCIIMPICLHILWLVNYTYIMLMHNGRVIPLRLSISRPPCWYNIVILAQCWYNIMLAPFLFWYHYVSTLVTLLMSCHFGTTLSVWHHVNTTLWILGLCIITFLWYI